ncbi:DUF4836 family protein [Sphingobacterium athyrii]|uniref:DUF4836 domain-containing protein n=1 Tax=Sphingobacterium athyrii TaxID=2152717 RepID=A0A363NMY2_9SPHI|nr:DUF4836 family protein [Sphingobacterium athyrii]PUV22134.1 hypothetical protein DCO56_24735 [Sphingobacterium athyrii]
MKSKILLTGLACLSLMGSVKSQDLIQLIPEEAEMIAAFNVKEIVQKANANKLNELLQKAGLFKRIEKSGASVGNDIKNLGIDLTQTSYFYSRKTDSVSFIEFIFPLSNKGQFEKLLHDAGEPKPFANGYSSIALKPGSMLVYNDRMARFISSTMNTTFLDNDSVANRYGIKKVAYMDPAADAYSPEIDSAAAVADSAAVAVDWEEGEKEIEPLSPPVIVESLPDTVVASVEAVVPVPMDVAPAEMHDPSYYDSLYTAYEDQNRKNDSIRNALRDKWLTGEATRLLSASYKPLSVSDQNKVLKNLGLIRLYVPHVEELYRGLMPYKSIPYLYMGINMDKFRTGYQDGVLDLSQEGNVLKLKGSMGLDKDLAEMSKRFYARKPNGKFSKFLTDKTLGFFNFNINSEAYLRDMPSYMAKYYGGLLGPQQDLVEWGLMALEVALDEKAIAQVMPGDHLFVVNGLRKFRKEYIDYTYDDDYNATEVKKTKDETLPVFIWMFTSKDQRLIKKGLDLAIAKSLGKTQDGIYAFSSKKAMDFPMYMLLKDDLVMVSNDSLSLLDIRQNKMAAPANKDFIKLMKQNKMSAAFDLQKLPAMLQEMGISPGRQWDKTFAQLNQYGSTAITSKGIVDNRMEAEMSSKLPQTKEGAISYMIDQILLEIDK